MAMVIPKVQVPMDFGLKFLGSPCHSNLKFLLQSGEELLANSMIISFNSPVIEKLTTDLFQSSIEVQDFSKEAVQCFLKASYSGKLEKITRVNFHDVNKMCHVFDVAWLVDRCFLFYKTLTTLALEANNYKDQLFVFDEAVFMLTKLKKKYYLEFLIKQFSSFTVSSKDFITEYLTDLPSRSTTCLDVIMDIGVKQEHIIIQTLTKHLEGNNNVIDANTRFLLEKLKFTSCKSVHQCLYQDLMENLERVENPTGDEYKLIVGILKRSSNALFKRRKVFTETNIPNLFHGFEHLQCILDFDYLIKFLTDSPVVKNGLMFYDGIYSWFYNRASLNAPNTFSFGSSASRPGPGFPFGNPSAIPELIPDSFMSQFSAAFKRRGWNPLPRELVNRHLEQSSGHSWLEKMTSLIIEGKDNVTENGYKRYLSVQNFTPKDLFARNSDILFLLKSDDCSSSRSKENSGFILRVTAASVKRNKSFNIELVTDPELYPKDVKFDSKFISSIESSHLTLDVTSEKGKVMINHEDMPVTWYGRPQTYSTGQQWHWGPRLFSEGGVEKLNFDNVQYKTVRNYSPKEFPDLKIRPVVYIYRNC